MYWYIVTGGRDEVTEGVLAKQACLPQGKAPIEFNLDELEDTSLSVQPWERKIIFTLQ